MKNAVYIFMFGGFVGTRLIEPDAMETLWRDDLFSDPCDDGAGWQIRVVPGGQLLEIAEEDGASIEVRERSADGRDWRTLTTFPYANDGLVMRSDAYDALSRWVAQRVGFVEKPFELVDLSHLSGAELEAAMRARPGV